jgi:hypothetical protein
MVRMCKLMMARESRQPRWNLDLASVCHILYVRSRRLGCNAASDEAARSYTDVLVYYDLTHICSSLLFSTQHSVLQNNTRSLESNVNYLVSVYTLIPLQANQMS